MRRGEEELAEGDFCLTLNESKHDPKRPYEAPLFWIGRIVSKTRKGYKLELFVEKSKGIYIPSQALFSEDRDAVFSLKGYFTETSQGKQKAWKLSRSIDLRTVKKKVRIEGMGLAPNQLKKTLYKLLPKESLRPKRTASRSASTPTHASSTSSKKMDTIIQVDEDEIESESNDERGSAEDKQDKEANASVEDLEQAESGSATTPRGTRGSGSQRGSSRARRSRGRVENSKVENDEISPESTETPVTNTPLISRRTRSRRKRGQSRENAHQESEIEEVEVSSESSFEGQRTAQVAPKSHATRARSRSISTEQSEEVNDTSGSVVDEEEEEEEEEEEDFDDEDDEEGGMPLNGDIADYIRVGRTFQAEIPAYLGTTPLDDYISNHVQVVGCPPICSVLHQSDVHAGEEWTSSEKALFEKCLYTHGANFRLIAQELNAAQEKKGRKGKKRGLAEDIPEIVESNPAAKPYPGFDGEYRGGTKAELLKNHHRTTRMCVQYFYDDFRRSRAYEAWRKHDEQRFIQMEREMIEAEKKEERRRRRERKQEEKKRAQRKGKDKISKSVKHDKKKKSSKKKEKHLISRRRSTLMNFVQPMARENRPWCDASCEFMPARVGEIPTEDLLDQLRSQDGKTSSISKEDLEMLQRNEKKTGRLTSSKPKYCVCNGHDDDGFMIRCTKCDHWFHAVCVGLRKDMLTEKSVFTCADCPSPYTSLLDGFKSPVLHNPVAWKIKSQRGESPFVLIATNDESVRLPRFLEPPKDVGCDGFPLTSGSIPFESLSFLTQPTRVFREEGQPGEGQKQQLESNKRAMEEDDDDDDGKEDDKNDEKADGEEGKEPSFEAIMMPSTVSVVDSIPLDENYAILLATRKVPVWDSKKKQLIAGEKAPNVMRLKEMLEENVSIRPWHGAIRRNCMHEKNIARKEERRRKRRRERRQAEREAKEAKKRKLAESVQENHARLVAQATLGLLPGQKPTDAQIRILAKAKVAKILSEITEPTTSSPQVQESLSDGNLIAVKDGNDKHNAPSLLLPHVPLAPLPTPGKRDAASFKRLRKRRAKQELFLLARLRKEFFERKAQETLDRSKAQKSLEAITPVQTPTSIGREPSPVARPLNVDTNVGVQNRAVTQVSQKLSPAEQGASPLRAAKPDEVKTLIKQYKENVEMLKRQLREAKTESERNSLKQQIMALVEACEAMESLVDHLEGEEDEPNVPSRTVDKASDLGPGSLAFARAKLEERKMKRQDSSEASLQKQLLAEQEKLEQQRLMEYVMLQEQKRMYIDELARQHGITPAMAAQLLEQEHYANSLMGDASLLLYGKDPVTGHALPNARGASLSALGSSSVEQERLSKTVKEVNQPLLDEMHRVIELQMHSISAKVFSLGAVLGMDHFVTFLTRVQDAVANNLVEVHQAAIEELTNHHNQQLVDCRAQPTMLKSLRKQQDYELTVLYAMHHDAMHQVQLIMADQLRETRIYMTSFPELVGLVDRTIDTAERTAREYKTKGNELWTGLNAKHAGSDPLPFALMLPVKFMDKIDIQKFRDDVQKEVAPGQRRTQSDVGGPHHSATSSSSSSSSTSSTSSMGGYGKSSQAELAAAQHQQQMMQALLHQQMQEQGHRQLLEQQHMLQLQQMQQHPYGALDPSLLQSYQAYYDPQLLAAQQLYQHQLQQQAEHQRRFH